MGLRSRKKVGVIGLGIIGSRVTASLRSAGHRVSVWNRTPRPEPGFLGSIAEIAANCDTIQIFVSDDAAVQACVDELLPCLERRHSVLCHATVMPETMIEASVRVRGSGAGFLDAPFTGSRNAAEQGQLVYYIGGDPDTLEKVRPVLQCSAREILRIGGVGDASLVKIATNMVTASTTRALAEALALVKAAQMDPAKFSDALEHNAARSGVTDLKLPAMIAGDFTPHFATKHMLKDMNLALKLGEKAGLELAATELVASSLLQQLAAGHADDDFSSIYQSIASTSARIAGATENQFQPPPQPPSSPLPPSPSPPPPETAVPPAFAPCETPRTSGLLRLRESLTDPDTPPENLPDAQPDAQPGEATGEEKLPFPSPTDLPSSEIPEHPVLDLPEVPAPPAPSPPYAIPPEGDDTPEMEESDTPPEIPAPAPNEENLPDESAGESEIPDDVAGKPDGPSESEPPEKPKPLHGKIRSIFAGPGRFRARK